MGAAPSSHAGVEREHARGSPLDRWLARIVIGLVLASALYLCATIGEPLRQNWGDPWSDGNAMTAGRYFARDGFVRNAFTPTLDVGPLTDQSLKYTHYPPLPDIVNGIEQSLLGARDISVFRIFAIAMTFGALFFLHRSVKRLWGSKTALFSVALFATNLLFLEYADCIHHVPLFWLTGFFALASGIDWLDKGQRRALAGCGAAIVLCFLASYDFYFFLPLMLIVAAIVLERRWNDRRVVLLAIVTLGAGTLAVLTKTALVIWAVGFAAFKADFIFQFFERATARHADDYTGALAPILVGRVWRLFGPLFIVAIAAQLVAIVDRFRRRAPFVSASPLLVLVAGVPFVVVFSQLFCEQYHPTLQFLPYYAIGGGAVLAAVWTHDSPRSKTAALAALALCVGWQVIELARFPKATISREEVAAVKKILDASDRRNFALSNVAVDSTLRFYWERHLVGIPIKRELISMRENFDKFGSDGPITIIEYTRSDAVAYDKALYAFFAWERRWNWIGSPFTYRNEWRPRVASLVKLYRDSSARVGTLVYESSTLRVRSVTLADLDRRQREAIPEEETRFIDFESRSAERHKLYGFWEPEYYEGNHGFSWMQSRQPIELVFTLHGLKPVEKGPPVMKSALRVRLTADRSYKLSAFGFSAEREQRLSFRVNDSVRTQTVSAACPNGARTFEFDISSDELRADGIQDLEFSFDHTDKYGNALLFHTVRIDPLPN